MIAARHETTIRSGAGAMTMPIEPQSLFRAWYVRNGMQHYDGDLMAFVSDPELQRRYLQEIENQEEVKKIQQEQNILNSQQCTVEDRTKQLWAAWEEDCEDYMKALGRAMDRAGFRFDRLPLGLRDRQPPLPKEIMAGGLKHLPKRENTISEKARASRNAKLEKDLGDRRGTLEALHDPRWTADVVGGQDSRKIFLRHWRDTQRGLNRPCDWLAFDLEARSKVIRSCWKAFVGEGCINHNGSRPYDPNL
jgi:hypothetical protein